EDHFADPVVEHCSMQSWNRAALLPVNVNLVSINNLASREQIDAPRYIKRAHSNHSFADKQGCHRILIISEVLAKFPAGYIRVSGFAKAAGVDGKHNHPRRHQLLRLRS